MIYVDKATINGIRNSALNIQKLVAEIENQEIKNEEMLVTNYDVRKRMEEMILKQLDDLSNGKYCEKYTLRELGPSALNDVLAFVRSFS